MRDGVACINPRRELQFLIPKVRMSNPSPSSFSQYSEVHGRDRRDHCTLRILVYKFYSVKQIINLNKKL
jgi:hypothetical protein